MVYFFFLLSSFLYAQSYLLEDIHYNDKTQVHLERSIQDIIVLDDFENEKSLEDVLRNIPGVLIKRNSGVSSFNYRGLPSKYSLVLLNGKRIVDVSGIDSGLNLDSIDIAVVDRIEILNGTSALAFGSGSYASVINIITENYKNEAQLSTGTRDRLSLKGAKTLDNSVVYGKLFYEEDESLSAIQNGKEKDKIQRKGINLGFEKEFLNGELSLDVYGLKDFREIDGYYNFLLTDLDGIYTKKEVANSSFNLKLNKIKFSSSFFYSDRYTLSYISNALSESKFESKNFINNIEYSDQGFIVGIESDYQKSIAVDKFNQSIYSVYIIKDFKFKNNLSTSVSFRSEYLKGKVNNAFAFGGAKKIGLYSQIVLNYSRGFKRPSFYQRYDQFSGNSELSNEKSEIIDLSFQLLNMLKLSLFYNNLSNQIIYDLNTFQYTNISLLESTGVEFKYNKSIEQFHFEVGGTLFKTSVENFREGYFASLSYDLNRWKISSRFNHVGATEDSFNKLKSYNLLYIGFEKKINDLSLSLNVYNTLNESYQETTGYETLGRNLEFRAKYRF